MKRRTGRVYTTILILLLTLTVVLLIVKIKPAPTQAQIQKQKGITFVSWWPGEYSAPDADLALANLAHTGANWISLVVTQYQDDITSTTIVPTTATPTDADLIHVITQAHNLGLKVMLKPHIDLSNDPTHWRGEIGQGFTETEWNIWVSSYQNFINHYAQLAQTHHVDQFCIGTELIATQSREANWRTIIAGVENRYNGLLTYAANWGSENDITWWDAVDYIGVDAYYPLTSKNNPTITELKTEWQPHVASLANLASTWNKSIIFTEIGYPSQDGANQHPWDQQVGGTLDLQEQADTYQAALESFFNQSWFAGMYWWAWEVDPFQGGPCDDNFTPYEKPAEDVLRSWYGASPRVYRSKPQPDYSKVLNIYTDGLGTDWEDWSWDSTVDLNASDLVYSGTHAISITAQAWGALSLHHPDFDSTPYYWLEFYVRKSSTGQRLKAFANDANDTELRSLIVDCRYTDGVTPIETGVWTRVRIPLEDLNAAGKQLQRVSIRKEDDQISSFGVDEIRLMGVSWPEYLPVIFRNP